MARTRNDLAEDHLSRLGVCQIDCSRVLGQDTALRMLAELVNLAPFLGRANLPSRTPIATFRNAFAYLNNTQGP